MAMMHGIRLAHWCMMSVERGKGMAEHLHDGHRQRMRDRFVHHGLSGFSEHEVLEMLLYYAIPRINTNDIAHRLIAQFGSLYGVLCADMKDLQKVKGVTENAAVLLKMFPAVYPKCLRVNHVVCSLYCPDDSMQYFQAVYAFDTVEVLRIACLHNDLRIQSCEVIAQGKVTRVESAVEDIVRYCTQHDCANVIIAHNHPEATALPSAQDIASTHHLFEKLDYYNISLIDHIIIGADGGAHSMRKSGVILFQSARL